MLKARVFTALFLVSIFLPLLFYAPVYLIQIVFSAVFLLISWELATLVFNKRKFHVIAFTLVTFFHIIICWLIIFGLASIKPIHTPYYLYFCITISTIFWIIGVPFILSKGINALHGVTTLWLFIIGEILLAGSWYSVLILINQSVLLFMRILIIVFLADIGAYFIGKQFGKTKLAPLISPGKSIEGVSGALIVNIIFSYILWCFNLDPLASINGKEVNFYWILLLNLFLVSYSVLGDLFESLLKRIAKVKDSGNFLPGHGGVLDRTDSLLPVLCITSTLMICIP
ncbi:MAG: phosphatidate cytidylyltransferase [Betaproteobacteria bacterium]|jgi:phosphatidate cytidylyltransferase